MKNNLITKRSHGRAVSFLTMLVICAFAFSGCKDSNSSSPATMYGNVSNPGWTVSENYDYTASMTAVVKVDLAALYPISAKDFVLEQNDVLAAFSGETCLGVASPQNGLFFLYIAGPASAGTGVSLRYYSAHYKNLFVAKDAFDFKNDSHLGTVAAPLTPNFVVEK